MIIWSLFAILMLFHTLLPSMASKSFSPSDIPNPMKNPAGCGRPNVKSSAICDPENILTKENKEVIEGFINAIPPETAQIAVVIIRSMDTKFIGSSSIEDATEKFARNLHDTWGVGNEATQNGILLFLSLTSRSVFISTGDGVKSKLSKAILEGYIINEVMKPELKYKYYSSAIEKAVFEMDNILSGKSNISAMYYNAASWMDSWFVKTGGFICIFALVFYWSWCEGERMRKLERGRRALDELMTEITEGDTHFEARSCPICLEMFTTSGDEPETVDVPDLPTGAANKTNATPILSSSEKTGGHKNPLRPMKLQCGHLFCYGCLSEYLKTNDGKKCPICRAPVTGERPEPGPPPPGYGNTGSNSGSNNCAQGFANEAGTIPSPTSTNNTNNYNPFSWGNNVGYRRSRFTRLVGWEHRQAEYAYRVNRMNHLYPEVVNAETVFALNTALQTGSVDDFRRIAVARSTVVMRTITDLKTRAKAAKSGSKGSSSGSWGGGRSSGGGGGRW